jgi:ribosomal protein S6E (S10)
VNRISNEAVEAAELKTTDLLSLLKDLAAHWSVFLEDPAIFEPVSLLLRGGVEWRGFPMRIQEFADRAPQVAFLSWNERRKPNPSWVLLPFSEIQCVEVSDLPVIRRQLRLLQSVGSCTRLEFLRFAESLAKEMSTLWRGPFQVRVDTESFPEGFQKYAVAKKVLENFRDAFVLLTKDQANLEVISKSVGGVELFRCSEAVQLSVTGGYLKFSSPFSEGVLLRHSQERFAELISKLF